MREISPKPLTDGDFSCIIHTQASIMYALNEALDPHNSNYVKAFFFIFHILRILWSIGRIAR